MHVREGEIREAMYEEGEERGGPGDMAMRNAVVLFVLQTWFGKTPLGKKRSKAAQGDDADTGAKKAKKGKKGKK